MARFRGTIGFVQSVETSPGIYTEVPTEKVYSGDVLRDARNWESGGYINDNLRIANRLSIVADSFAVDNASFMRYVKWMGASWKITSVEIQRPRLILSLGDKYNG